MPGTRSINFAETSCRIRVRKCAGLTLEGEVTESAGSWLAGAEEFSLTRL
jgi:hypothetical protein